MTADEQNKLDNKSSSKVSIISLLNSSTPRSTASCVAIFFDQPFWVDPDKSISSLHLAFDSDEIGRIAKTGLSGLGNDRI